MRRRRIIGAIGAIALAPGLTACIPDYLDSSACTSVSQDVTAVLADETRVSSELRKGYFPANYSLSDSEAATWCVLSFDTKLDLPQEDVKRQDVKAKVEDIVAELYEGAYVTITYASIEAERSEPERQDSFTSPGTLPETR